MAAYKLYQVDAFTSQSFTGNPAGIVANADGLSDEQMQAIAREMNCSETAFILLPTGSDHDLWIRYFTPTVEVPVCGHATIAAHYVRATEKKLTQPLRVMMKTGVGILPVDVTMDNNDYKITMTQGQPEFGGLIEGNNRQRLLTALGLSAADLDSRCPIQIVSTGHSKVMVGIKKRDKLDSLTPDLAVLKSLSKTIACNGYFIFTFDSGDPDIMTSGRMFAPAMGINEDPVTGNAHGPLGAYLVHHKLVKVNGDLLKFKAKQGEAIKRSGIVDVSISIEKGEPAQVKVGGNAVVVFKTSINA